MLRSLTLAAALVLAGPALATPIPRPKPPITITDGDTIRLGNERIRLLGLDAPETHQARCRAERRLGDRATERLRDLLASGDVRIERGPRPDKYRRTLAVVTVDGRDVAAILITEGLARPYDGGRRLPWCDVLEPSHD